MTSRCWFITSSYSSSFLRAWKFCSSTRFCAWPMALVTQGWVMTSPSSAPVRSIQRAMRSEPKRRMRSSSRERKKTLWPGAPCRPERPRSWRSMRRASWRSVPMITSPHGGSASQPSRLISSGGEVRPLDHLPERRLAARPDAAHGALLHAWAELDVGAAAGHVGGNRDGGGLTRLSDDLRFALVVLRVQHLVPQPPALEHPG